MKKSIKSVLAKSLAVVMAFSLAGIAPNTSSEAAAKKPTLTKKVTVTVGKKKTVKVTSKKKVKKTTWSLNKKGKKVVSLSKKKAKSVVVKGKKAGKATLTAKIKVGKKTYKKTCKITVKKASKVNVTPVPAKTDAAKATSTPANNNNNNGGSTATATPKPTEAPVSVIKTEAGTYTVDESATYNVPLTELNETTFTCDAKRSDGETVKDGTLYNKDGSVTFTSTKDYNSGVSYYINPATKDDDIIDISDTRGEGFMGYDNGTKDMSAYDYVRVKVTSENEMNCRTYNGNDQLRSAGFPGSSSSETYEGGWIHTDDEIWEAESTFTAGNTVKAAYKTRTIFIPISMLMGKGMNPETLTAIAFCPQSSGAEVTIHRIDFVKVKYDKLVTGIDVKAAKTEIAPGKTTTVTATVTPADATRQIVKWTSSNEDVATVTFNGTVLAKKGAEGTTTITATSTDGSNVSASCMVHVDNAKVSGIVLSDTVKNVSSKTQFTLKTTIAPADAYNKKLKWSSSNSDVAYVNQNGDVIADESGSAVITATTTDGSNLSASCVVHVTNKVTYQLNGGKNNSANPTIINGSRIILKNPTRAGYIFKGWYKDNYKKITEIPAGYNYHTMNLVAKWEKVTVGKPVITSFYNRSGKKAVLKYKGVSKASGYQIVYSTNKKLKKKCTTITTKSKNYTLKKLAKKKTYYVKVRAYRIDSTGKKIYGRYTGVRKVRINK